MSDQSVNFDEQLRAEIQMVKQNHFIQRQMEDQLQKFGTPYYGDEIESEQHVSQPVKPNPFK